MGKKDGVVYTPVDVVEKICTTDFHNESLNRVRDLFVFQAHLCYQVPEQRDTLGGGSKASWAQHNQDNTALCHPSNSESFEKDVDLIVFRNTGGVSGFKDEYESFVKRVKAQQLNTFNEFTGKADIGKLPDVPKYVIKPKDGADSIGLEFLTREGLMARNLVPAFSHNAKNTSRKVKRSQSRYVYFCVQSIDPS